MVAHNGPCLLNVKVKRNENCYPMVAPGKSNSQMIGLPERPQADKLNDPVTCTRCGTENTPEHNFCPSCGTKL